MNLTGEASPRARPKWHYIYFLLAAFDLLTVSAGLYLTHEIMAIYTRSVAVNQLWSERAAEFSRLADLAGAVNAPGNDVFDSREVAAESQRMQLALTRFEHELATLRQSLSGDQAPPEAAALVGRLDRVSTAMDRMIAEANQIFRHFNDGRAELAGARMASMDRTFAALLSAIAELRVAVTEIQQQNFIRQTAAAEKLQHYEYAIGVMILLMVVAATLYGQRIARQMQAHAAERERHLAALGEADAALREERDRLQVLNDKLSDTHNQLVQADKMAAIGQLAAGVAHEINNPMAFIASNVNTFESYVKALLEVIAAYENTADTLLAQDSGRNAAVRDAKAAADLDYLRADLPTLFEETRDGVQRVRMIVQDLKELSHTGSNDWQRADLHKGLDSTLNVVRNEIKYKAAVVKEYGELPLVECIAPQVNQVFMNLLVNAAHAIEQRGTITVRTGQQDGMVWAEIEDTGSGIAPQHLERIFEPFFTTKPVGKGTGLGLSLCYGIVNKHGGRIEVRSEVGKGSAFRLWLPVSRTNCPPAQATTTTATACAAS